MKSGTHVSWTVISYSILFFRYFDMNVSRCHGAFYGEHSLYTKPLRNYLRQMVTFLDVHRREVIILHFTSFTYLELKEKRSLLTVLYQFFGSRICRASQVSSLTLSELWKNGKQIVLMFPDVEIEHLRNHIFCGLVWSDKIATVSRPVKRSSQDLLLYLTCTYDDERSEDMLHIIHACITPDLKKVFCGEYHYRSLKEFVLSEVNCQLADWLSEHPRLNIVCFDFVGCHEVAGAIIELNEHKKVESVV